MADTMTKPLTLTGPYYSTEGEAWKGPNGEPLERAFVRGPGLEGTLSGPNAFAEARARAQQLNTAYQCGIEKIVRIKARDENLAKTRRKSPTKTRRKRGR